MVEGRVASGTAQVVVRVDGRVVGVVRPRGQAFTADLELPPRELTLRLESVDAAIGILERLELF